MSPAIATALLILASGGALRQAVHAGCRKDVARRLPGASRQEHRPHLAAPRRLAPALAAAGFDFDADTAFTAWCASVPVVCGLALVMAGPVLAGLAAAAALAAPILVLRSRRGAGDARVESDLPAALEAVARAMRSGASLRQAVEEAAGRTPGSLGSELATVAAQAARGAPLVQALEGLAERRQLPGVRLAVAALCLGAETGGAQAKAVDGVATTLRDRLGVIAEVKALSAQARISAVVMSVAPLGFGAFAAATDPRTGAFLFHTMAGLVLLAAGAALDGLGWLWMSRLSRVAA
ncbi:MAG: type II secretion system F family protein [Acidimicrobiales bacterium]